ncbi:MAG: hypothetical protein LBI56_01850 [Puniceicoccales bacterium]|nr:hypothetical protein [Puniceicoccales bacterium]
MAIQVSQRALKKVRIYEDEGVGRRYLPYVLHMFRDYDATTIDAAEVVDGRWMEEAAVLCIPGGAARFYAEKLNGRGNENIKSFAQKGGAYLGICAGAYYGAARTEFYRGDPLEIICEDELKFFRGTAIGPAFGKLVYGTDRYVTFSNNIIDFQNEKKHANVMFYGGPYFTDLERDDEISILARYGEIDQPSIIHKKYGRGSVVLCGVHPCIDETFFTEKASKYLLKLGAPLSQTAAVRRELIESIFRLLGLCD